MNIQLADPAQSRIVLIGTPSHVHADERLPDVPVVANNLTDLAAVFTDPELGGFDAQHCVTATSSAGMPEIGEILANAAEGAKDLLLIYYAGHGLLDRRGDLHLTLAGTHPDRLGFTALPYETLRSVCLDSTAKSRVVILDSCYSGRAIGQPLSSPEQEILEQLQVTGTYTLTSAPANRTALILPGERHTAFTGRLLNLLRDGHPEMGEVLSMGEIYRRLHAQLTADGLPEPQQRGTATADLLGLVRNRRPAAPPIATLPVEIQEALDSRAPELQLAAVKWLGDWLTHPDQARARAAVIALKNVADHDDPTVADATKALLADVKTNAHAANVGGLKARLLTVANAEEADAGAAELAAVRARHAPWKKARLSFGPALTRLTRLPPAKTTAILNPEWVAAIRRVAGQAESIANTYSGRALVALLADVARTWATVDTAEARRVATKAEEKISRTTNDEVKVSLLAEVAQAWAVVDPKEAQRVVAEAEEIADEITQDAASADWARVDVARGWAAVSPARAESIAKTIIAGLARARALGYVTQGWVAKDPVSAYRIAKTISIDTMRARALAETASGWVAVDPAQAWLAAVEAEQVANTSLAKDGRAEALARVAIGWATVDQAEARRVAMDAESITDSIRDDDLRVTTLVAVVHGWSAIDPARAEETASHIMGEMQQSNALAGVARGWAAIDPAKAEKIAKNITVASYQVEALAGIGRAWAEIAKLG